MRLYYLVDAIPTDDEEGITADIPSGVSWVGNTDGLTYVVLTDTEVARFRLVEAEPADDPEWEPLTAYALDDRRMWQGIVYRCIQPHTNSNPADTPDLTPALWTVARSDGDPWVQPTMAEDAYNIGDIVFHLDVLWSSKISANTTTPGSDDRWWEQVATLTERTQQVVVNGAPFAPSDPLSVWSVGGN